MTIIRKLMLLGDVGVGKTSIANRLLFDRFETSYKATVGCDIYQYDVQPSPTSDRFLFNIWDTDGNFGDAMFKSIYIRGAHAAFVCGDVKRPRTLTAMLRLANAFEAEVPGRFVCCIINKTDLLEPGEDPELPVELANSGLPYVFTSAADGTNVARTFQDAAATIIRRHL